ncbi:MAG: DUF421 domain-containing protein [Clostridiales bacterium]|jgi:uncharacterized membrane protein YcaP (DUF421 family)|nr:DUF421 domain-containing protein [Clostridiales bacterium]
MLIVFLKAMIVYIVMLFVIRVMGKRQIGEMQPFEFVITLLIAEVAAIPLNDPYIPLHFGLIPMLVLVVVHVVMSVLARHSLVWRHILSGKSVIAVDKGTINYANLKKMNMNISDLIEAIRCEAQPDFLKIEYAIFETNGQICIIEKASDPTQVSPALLPLTIITDGKWDQKEATNVGVTMPQIQKLLFKHGIRKISDVALLDIRQDGNAYVCTKSNVSFSAKISVVHQW